MADYKENMRNRSKQSGLTLTEVLTTMVIIALLTAFSLPAINAMMDSFGSEGSAEAMINAALSNARAIAIKEHRYAGIRFQLAYDPCNPNPFNANQYMIFIVQDPAIMAYGFRAVDGMKPIKLPQNIAVCDLYFITSHKINSPISSVEQTITLDNQIMEEKVFTDTSAFSVIFSPQGNMVIHGLRIRNRDGYTNNDSRDDVFNTKQNVEVNGYGMFYQDDYFEGETFDFGLGPEPSRRNFIIYEKNKFKEALSKGVPYSQYLEGLVNNKLYVNPYTGTLISTD